MWRVSQQNEAVADRQQGGLSSLLQDVIVTGNSYRETSNERRSSIPRWTKQVCPAWLSCLDNMRARAPPSRLIPGLGTSGELQEPGVEPVVLHASRHHALQHKQSVRILIGYNGPVVQPVHCGVAQTGLPTSRLGRSGARFCCGQQRTCRPPERP